MRLSQDWDWKASNIFVAKTLLQLVAFIHALCQWCTQQCIICALFLQTFGWKQIPYLMRPILKIKTSPSKNASNSKTTQSKSMKKTSWDQALVQSWTVCKLMNIKTLNINLRGKAKQRLQQTTVISCIHYKLFIKNSKQHLRFKLFYFCPKAEKEPT